MVAPQDLGTQECGVPVLDMQQSDAQLAKEVRAACITYGFFIVRGHGVSEKLIADMFERNKAFFSLPLEEKNKIASKHDANFRGFTPMQEETLDATSTAGDTKEGLNIGRERPADDPTPLSGPNQWPSEDLVPGYRATTEAYTAALQDLGLRLVQLIALALNLDKHHFDAFFQEPMTVLRPLHYSAHVSSEKEGIYGAGAHSDYGMLTILKTSEERGLQVHVDGKWIDVEPPQDGFIVNLGDMLERWTNKLFTSTLHRVMGLGRERYSIPYFYEPAFYTRVECLPSCVTPENPARYPPTTSGEYLLGKYSQTHASYSEDTHRKA